MNNFVPVCEPHLGGREVDYVTQAVQTGWISSAGEFVKQFESDFATVCSVRHAVGVCNGTSALHLALKALEIGENDEVIIPSFTMVASAFAVCYTGAKPVFVDCDASSWNIDVAQIESKITRKTKAIMVVHIFGLPCDMSAIHNLAQAYNLYVIEDAAEAHGAEYQSQRVGSLSDIAAFSFFANKNITTGEGGMVVTNSQKLFEASQYYKNLCFSLNGNRNYLHDHIGFNYRLSNLHAAIGVAQLEKFDMYKSLRIQNRQRYQLFLKELEGVHFQEDFDDRVNVAWMNAIVIDPNQYGKHRDELMAYLKDNNVDARVLFNGMHRQKSLKNYGCDCSGYFPNCDNLSDNGLYLPSASSLSEETIFRICELIIRFLIK